MTLMESKKEEAKKRIEKFRIHDEKFQLLKTIDEDDKPIFISFSGGETSGDMLLRVWEKYNGKRKIVVLFANTGHEWEQTLQFVHDIETFYEIPIVWIEAIVDPRYRKGIKHRVVDFYTAKRDTDKETSMEKIIQKLGIPNKENHHCTRDLKTRAMESYLKSIGLKDFHTLVGIRYDEIERATSQKLFYEPVISKVTKKDVNERWRNRPFRLNLKGYQGNCKWCHKKTLRKLLTIMKETPEVFDFPERMENEFGNFVNEERKKQMIKKGKSIHFPIRFYRENRSVNDLRLMAENYNEGYPDENDIYNFDETLDSPNGDCFDSCEPFK